MRTVDNTNFSGGIHEATAPSDFTDRQWTALKGFYLKDETRLKTQWPLQSIGSETLLAGFVSIDYKTPIVKAPVLPVPDYA